MEERPQKPLTGFAIFILTCGGAVLAAWAYGRDLTEIIRVAVSAAAGAGALSVMVGDFVSKGDMIYDNGEHTRRFYTAYLISLALCLFLPLIVADAWPFLSIYVVLSLLSAPVLGAYAATMLLMLTVLIQGGGTPEFFMYVFAGLIALIMFRSLDVQMRAGLPLFIALMLQTVFLVCYHVMFLNESLSFAVLAVPVINAFINFAILIIVLNAFSFYVVRRDAERYMEINDPAFSLMLRIRDADEKEYQRAIHTDYLTQRVAAALELDTQNIRSCSYYHRAGIALGKRGAEECEALFSEYHFPKEAISLLMESVTHKKGEPMSAEITVVSLCETMIASLQFMFDKDRSVKINYDKLVDKIFEKKEADGELSQSMLSLKGLDVTKKLLKKETLYYDFLR